MSAARPPLCFFCRAPLDGQHPGTPEACRDELAALLTGAPLIR